ncbi:MAG TPA: aminotransferase class IV, partial [Steroidobacteraceae bacterium]|nr:aminotransferase class IV [Steroidobacteraceae bacterium]
NGDYLSGAEAAVSVFDHGFLFGDGVFESLIAVAGRIFALEEHLARLRSSALALAFAEIPSDEKIVGEIRRTLAANGMKDGVHIRLTLTRGVKVTSGMDPRLNQSGPTLIVLAEHKAPVYSKGGLKLVTSSVRRPGPDVLDPRIHHANLLNSVLAKIQANAAGADDAIMLDARGFIAETNATHLFLVQDGVVRTPTTAACPEGITRMTVLDILAKEGIPHEVRDLSLTELYRADECFCTGTMGELAGVTEADGRKIGDGEIGDMTRRLSALYAKRTASGGTQVVD